MLDIFRPHQQENWEKRLKCHQENTFLITMKTVGPVQGIQAVVSARLLAQIEFPALLWAVLSQVALQSLFDPCHRVTWQRDETLTVPT